MDQGYQMFSQYYIQPIKKVCTVIARTAVRSSSSLIRGTAHSIKSASKSAARELYKRTVATRLDLRQAKKRKRMELELEQKYGQKKCETYIDKYDSMISPNLKQAGISSEKCIGIRNQWMELAAPDIDPYSTMIDYATLQKGFESFHLAVMSFDTVKISEAVKNWDKLYEARASMRGREKEFFDISENELTESPHNNISNDGFYYDDPGHSVVKKEKIKITPDRMRDFGSEYVKTRDEYYKWYFDPDQSFRGPMPKSMPPSHSQGLRNSAKKAGEQLKKEEERIKSSMSRTEKRILQYLEK